MPVRKFLAGWICFFISLGVLTYISSDMALNFTDKNFMKNIIEKKLGENITNIGMLSQACEINPSFSISIQEINITCSDILGKNSTELISYISSKIASNFYEREIDCEIIDCLREKRFDVIFSEKAKIFFQDVKTKTMYITILLIVLLFFIEKSFISVTRKLGYTLLFTALPLYAFNFFLPQTLENFVPTEVKEFIPYVIEKISSVNYLLIIIAIIGFYFFIASYLIEEIKKKRT